MINTNTNTITFGSIKPNIELGRRVVANYRREYPFLLSNSRIGLKLYQLGDDAKIKPNASKDRVALALGKVNIKAIMAINDLRAEFKALEYLSGDAIKEAIKNLIKTRKAGNCKEDVNIVCEELKKLGSKPKKVKLEIVDPLDPKKIAAGRNKSNYDHVFIVTGMRDRASIDNPASWGSRSVIIDPFFGMVQSAFDMLEHYKQLYRFNQNKETIIFSETPSKYFDAK